MSFCINCGKQIQTNVRFCKFCGAEIKAAPQKAAAYVDSGEEETVFMEPTPDEQVEYPAPPLEDDCPVVAVFDEPPKKKKHVVRWFILLLILLLLAGAAVYLVYNDNYKTVLSSIGVWQEQGPETIASGMDVATTIAPSQAEKATDPPLEFVFPEITTLPSTTTAPDIIVPPGSVNAVQELYKVVTQGDDLRIRIGPGTEFEQIGRIPTDTIVIVTQKYDIWGYIEYDGKSGWASMDYMVLVE